MAAFLSLNGIRKRIAALRNRSFAKMNQRPKLGSEGRGVNVRFWVPFRVCSRTLLASDGDIGEPSDVSVPLAPEDDLPRSCGAGRYSGASNEPQNISF